ncbi:peptide-methionine (S)-S-oxide reductase [Litorimonas haliclonae]|uniref:peptide-methionine (S)-S-oxide reductase n=1 Tax=Litorimonas haliclonae TaxID=2081977 RepID=UPI0039EE657B
MDTSVNIIGFGGGCHWCTEAVFQTLRGVKSVEQGFIKSDPPHDSWSEAVRINFDPEIIPLTALVAIHLRTHSSQSDHTFRGKYRSAIYVTNDSQMTEAEAILKDEETEFDNPLVTHVLPLKEFKSSPDVFKDYYKTDPERPFCKAYIDPKLTKLRRDYANYVS